MSTATRIRLQPALPRPPASFFLRRFTVDEYHRMIETDILNPEDKVELLEGWIVQKMPQKPAHASAIQKLFKVVYHSIPSDWDCRSQLPITLATSEPEPDIAVVRGSAESYEDRHPGPEDIGLLIEISRTSLAKDRAEKARIYAAAGIPEYWIVNVKAGVIEVFRKPVSGKHARYKFVQEYRKADVIPLTLRGKKIADIPLRNIFK